MISLELLQEQPRKNRKKNTKAAKSLGQDPAPELPRNPYFQIHFQHIHENIGDVQEELKAFKQHVADLNAKLDQLTALLVEQQRVLNATPCMATAKAAKHLEH